MIEARTSGQRTGPTGPHMQPLHIEAVDLYAHARRHGQWHRVLAALSGHSSRPLDLATITAGGNIRASYAAGNQTVPIRLIRGSEGRIRDFDADLHSLGRHTRKRWQGVAEAWLGGSTFPPVALI